jgi:hypothetical protein
MHRIHGWWVGALVALAMAADTPASAQVNAWEPAAATSDLAPMRTGHAPTAATSGFWEVLADTTLARLLDEAGRRSFDIRAAMARVEGAGASRLHAALDLLLSGCRTRSASRPERLGVRAQRLLGGRRLRPRPQWRPSPQRPRRVRRGRRPRDGNRDRSGAGTFVLPPSRSAGPTRGRPAQCGEPA